MFCILFIGFVLAFTIGFGDIILDLSTFYDTVVFLIRAYLRDVSIEAAYDELPALTGFMVIIYYIGLVLIAIVVVNAIISEALLASKSAPKKKKKTEPEDYMDEPVEDTGRAIRERKDRLVRRTFKKNIVFAGYSFNIRKALLSKKGPKDIDPDEIGGFSDVKEDEEDDDFFNEDDGESDEDFESSDEEGQLTRKDLMKSIEHMSGRVLSEISIVGIEVKSELHDVCERVAQMQMALQELGARTDLIIEEQTDLNEKT
jgi:hypothetical protein